MAASEHSDEAEITAFVHHSPGQPPLEPAIQDTAPQGSPSTVPNTPDEVATRQRERLSTSQVSGTIFHYYASIQNLMLFPVMLFPVNISAPKKRGTMIPSSERSFKTRKATIEDERQLQRGVKTRKASIEDERQLQGGIKKRKATIEDERQLQGIKKRKATIGDERQLRGSIKTQKATIEDERQLQGGINIPWSAEPLESMYPTPQRSEIPGSESIPTVVERHSSTPGAAVENAAVSILASNDDDLMHEYVASPISGESNSVLNTTVCIDADEQSSQNHSLEGGVLF